MIDDLYLRNLKCFKELDFRLAPLTLLTGFNAAGKSTTLQALLLMAQTFRSHSVSGELRLNGPLVSLGTPGELLNEANAGGKLVLGFSIEKQTFRWTFDVADDGSRRYLRAEELKTDLLSAEHRKQDQVTEVFPSVRDREFQRQCQPVEDITYLGAARQADSDVFPVPDISMPVGDPGKVGQFAPWQFYQHGDDALDVRKCRDAHEPGTVRLELNRWLSAFFPGAEANALPVPKTDLMKLEFRTGAGGDWQRPSNVGFGLSYAFPMLVAGLCSVAGQTTIIDSPEAHLHPHGQSIAGRFAAQVVSSGQQLIVETHSDHFLNGVRLAVKDGVLAPKDVAIYFFNREGRSHVEELMIDGKGNLSRWPEGFFDQGEQDLAALAGWA